jgi:hypothetical protein
MDKLLLVLSILTLPGTLLLITGLADLSTVKEEKDKITYNIAVFLRFTSILTLALAIFGIIAYILN